MTAFGGFGGDGSHAVDEVCILASLIGLWGMQDTDAMRTRQHETDDDLHFYGLVHSGFGA